MTATSPTLSAPADVAEPVAVVPPDAVQPPLDPLLKPAALAGATPRPKQIIATVSLTPAEQDVSKSVATPPTTPTTLQPPQLLPQSAMPAMRAAATSLFGANTTAATNAQQRKDAAAATAAQQRKDQDLMIILANKNREMAAMAETLRNAEEQYFTNQKKSDDKIQKMRSLLTQASRKINDSKTSMKERDDRIGALQAQIDDLNLVICGMNVERREGEEATAGVRKMWEEERMGWKVREENYEKALKDAKAETLQVKSEFQSYKVKAHSALQQSGLTESVAKVADLKDDITRLSEEKIKLESSLHAALTRATHLESDLTTTLETLTAFESELNTLRHLSREHPQLRTDLQSALARLDAQRDANAESHRAKDHAHASAIASLRDDLKTTIDLLERQLHSKSAECTSLLRISENLAAELASARSEAASAVEEADRAKSTAAAASAAAATGVVMNPASVAKGVARGGGFFSGSSRELGRWSRSSSFSGALSAGPAGRPVESFAELLTKSVALGTGNAGGGEAGVAGNGLLVSSMKGKELVMRMEQLEELLGESEKEVKRLGMLEQVLRDEIRLYEKGEKLQNLNVVYLKNIVLTFLETELKDSLIPAITKLLDLNPDEVRRIKKRAKSGPFWALKSTFP
ncbi:hypothetical protein HK101_003660 [Irineochytrium annulatum]|nr:hypothetical protein HK101_003660 [Irineochytrium annulatum]